MPHVLPIALFLFAMPIAAQSFGFDETMGGGGSDDDSGRGIALSADGDRYVVGVFKSRATFGDVAITSAGAKDFFLVKYDASGEAVWARRGGTNGFSDYGTAVAVAPDGSVYAAGLFTSNATFDGGDNPDILLLTFGASDAFLVKYDPDGNIQWVRQAGGTGRDNGRGLAVDASGSVYLAGSFEGTSTFGAFTLTSVGASDAFLAKYDPSGTVVWARRGGSAEDDFAYGVAVTADGRAHLSGSFQRLAGFGSLRLQSAGLSDVFVVQYDNAGNPVWATRIGADGEDFTRGGGIGLGLGGNVFVQGAFSNTITLGGDVLTSTGSTDIFVAKLDRDGNEIWGRRGGGDGENAPAALSVFGNGLLLTGYVEGTGTFAGTPITTQGRDGYFAAFDVTGNLFAIETLGGTGVDAGTGIASDLSTSRFALTGQFEGTAAFGDLSLTSVGGSDAYVVGGRFNLTDAVEPGAGTPAANLLGTPHPNPFSQRTTLALDVAEAQDVTVEVFDVLGRRVATVHDGPLAVGAHRVVIEAAGLPAGVYLVRASGETFRFTRRVTRAR